MREIAIWTEIALSIEHLKAHCKETNNRKSDGAVVEFINSRCLHRVGWKTLQPSRVHDFRHGRDRAKLSECELILNALRSIISEENIALPLTQLEVRYRHKLRGWLQYRFSTLFQGEELDDTADAVAAAWQFFYWSPIDRVRAPNPEFRGIGVFVQAAAPTSRMIDFFIISGHGRWNGEAFLNQSHFYMMCSDGKREESAFFLVNKPTGFRPMIAGVGAGPERWVENQEIRPALGFFCFGIKMTDATGNSLENNGVQMPDYLMKAQSIIQRAVSGQTLKPFQEESLREAFCRSYEKKSLQHNFGDLWRYLQNIHINKRQSLTRNPGPWLHIEWIQEIE